MQKCQYLYEKLTRKAYAGNMKSEIKYNAAGDALETIGRWQDWLKSERGYSEHTLDAYFRDLSAFFAFFERPLTLAKLGRLDVRDFRAYLASRAAKHLEKSSIAREVSAVKNFFQMAGPQQYCQESGNQRHIFAAEVKNSAQGAGY